MCSKKVIIFSAPSGAGKTTLINYLLKQGLPLAFSVSACTRIARGNEKNGEDYYFLSVDDFKKKITENAFIEWEEVYKDMFYGSLKDELERIWEDDKYVLFDVDVIGGINLKKIFKEQALAIFIAPSSQSILEERLRNRGTETTKSLVQRINKMDQELKKKNQFDTIIINDDLVLACRQLLKEVNHFLSKKS